MKELPWFHHRHGGFFIAIRFGLLKRYNKIFKKLCYNISVNIGTSPR